jgi:hypothetical protein
MLLTMIEKWQEVFLVECVLCIYILFFGKRKEKYVEFDSWHVRAR